MFSLSCPFQVQCLRKFVVTSCYITLLFLVKYVNLLYCTSQGLNLVHVYALFGSHIYWIQYTYSLSQTYNFTIFNLVTMCELNMLKSLR
jgi:hypothetical protein